MFTTITNPTINTGAIISIFYNFRTRCTDTLVQAWLGHTLVNIELTATASPSCSARAPKIANRK
jgi:hypothetical protein